jgi:hypothetical protein
MSGSRPLASTFAGGLGTVFTIMLRQQTLRASEDGIYVRKMLRKLVVVRLGIDIQRSASAGVIDGPLPFPLRDRINRSTTQRGDAGIAQRPAWIGSRDPAARSQDGVCDDEFVGWSANVHMRVVENEILDMDEFTRNPHAGSRIVEMPPLDEAGANRTTSRALVEPGELVLGATYVRKQHLEGQIGQSVSHCDISLIFLYGS